MAEFLIHGGIKLQGEIEIAGSKNAALPCMAASLLTKEEVILTNIPLIQDVNVMAEIIKSLGGAAEIDLDKKIIRISAKDISRGIVPEDLGRRLRASVLFLGALLGRVRNASLSYPGGDKIGRRPLATHLNALRQMNVDVLEEKDITADGSRMKGAAIILEEPSVTATENILLASVLAEGKTEIHIPALAPHIFELIKMLNSMGADIRLTDLGVIEVSGVKSLRGTTFEINPDELEISGFSVLAASTHSPVLLRKVNFEYIDAIILQLDKMGIEYEKQGKNLYVKGIAKDYQAFRIQSGLYPKLMSDHLPPFSVLATQAQGTSLIHEWLYEGRLKYIEELKKMGAKCEILDPHRALITGPSKLHGAPIVSYDIRAGLAVIVAALVAEGETRISGIENVARGYENIQGRLTNIGADIKII